METFWIVLITAYLTGLVVFSLIIHVYMRDEPDAEEGSNPAILVMLVLWPISLAAYFLMSDKTGGSQK